MIQWPSTVFASVCEQVYRSIFRCCGCLELIVRSHQSISRAASAAKPTGVQLGRCPGRACQKFCLCLVRAESSPKSASWAVRCRLRGKQVSSLQRLLQMRKLDINMDLLLQAAPSSKGVRLLSH